MAFKTGNSQLDYLMSRARRKNATKNALKQEEIDVDNISEREESEGNEESRSLDIGGVSSSSGIGVEPVGVSRSIEKAQEGINVASSMAGVGDPRDAGQIAFGMAKAAGEKSFMENKPFEAAVTGFYDSSLAQTAVNLAPAVAAYAGNIDLARGLSSVSGALTGPVPTLVTGALMGPSMPDPYGRTVAMGSGMLNKVSSAVMSTHFDVADKMAQGVAGYNQGYYRGNLVSIEPGIFGIGKVMTGVTVPSGSISDFEEAIKQAELQEDEDAASGYMQGNPAAMMQAGIGVSDFGSSTEAAQAGIGYSSYDPMGNPTGAAPAGSQYSYTGTFSTDNNDSDNNNGGGGFDSNTGGGGSDDYGSMFKKGGSVGMQMGGDPTQQAATGEMGFIEGPPDQFTEQQTIADDIPKTVPKGAFIINAPAVEFAGKEDIKQMLVEAYEIIAQADTDAGIDRTAQAAKIPSKEQVDIMISRGEVVVPPEIAKVIGYDRLEKINNRGKKEVSRRQEESQQQEKPQARQVAEGGFIGMQEGGDTSSNTTKDTTKLKRKKPDPNKLDQNIADFLGVFDDAQDASANSRIYTETYKPKDDDKTEDMVRHILGSGYMADNIIGSFAFDAKEESYRPLGKLYDKAYKIVTGKDRFVPSYDKTIRKESSIDLNNNEYGRLLREKYPKKEDFTKQVFLIGSSMAKGENPSKFAIGDLQPQLSLGSQILDKAGADKDTAIRKILQKGAEEGAFDPFADYNKQGNLQN
mgnify:CR=1 FL=1